MSAAAPRTLHFLFVSARYWPDLGGAERQLDLLASYLVGKGHRVTVLCQKAGSSPARETRDGLHVVRLPPSPGGLPSSLLFGLNLTRWLAALQTKVDICYCNLASSPALFARRWVEKKGVPMILKFGASGPFGDASASLRTFLGRRKLAALSSGVDLYLCPNAEIVKEFSALGYPRRRLEVFPNGVDTSRFRPADGEERRVLRSRFGWEGRTVALFAGRLEPQKNLPFLLQGWISAVRERPECLLVLAGPGSETAKLRRLARNEDGEEKIRFAGPVGGEEMPRLLQGADLFVMPSFSEGFSNAALEAAACGLPVLASDIPGNAELVHHGKNGLLFDPAGRESLHRALDAVLASQETRERFGRESRERAVRSYSIERVGERYLELALSLLGA